MKKNMTFKEFREELRLEYSMLAPSGYSVVETEMEDVNGLPVASLRFEKTFGDKVSKPFNMRGAYEAYLAGFDEEMIAFELFKGVEAFHFFSDEGYKVFPTLVCIDNLEKEGVRVNIDAIPHIMFTDLAMIFSIIPTVSSIRIPITDVDADAVELLKIAVANYKVSILPIGGSMCAISIGDGASAAGIFFPGALKKLSKDIGAEKEVVIIPSSSKEVIIFDPQQLGFDNLGKKEVEYLNEMIHTINGQDNAFADHSNALSEHGYVYDCTSETLRILE